MKDESVLKIIQYALNAEEGSIKGLKRVGGLTNVNYSVTVNDEKFIVRLAGEGTEELIDRQPEKDNLTLGTSLGINPELVYFNDHTGMKITRKIPQPTTLTMEQAKLPHNMNQVIDILHTLHSSQHVMRNRFELFTLMTTYENLVKGIRPAMFRHFSLLKKEIERLANVYESMHVEEVSCHIDTICDNFVSSGQGQMYLIDWEYSGMFDSLFDLATFIQDARLNNTEEQYFLEIYLGRQPTGEEIQRIELHKVFQDYLWSLWGVYKVACGDPLEEYANGLYQRLQKNLAHYKATYDEQPV